MGVRSKEEEAASLAQSSPGGINAQLEGLQEQRLEPERVIQGEVDRPNNKKLFCPRIGAGNFF